MAEWYVQHGGKAHGPFSPGQMKQLASSKQINEETAVRLGDGQWTAARNVKGLFTLTPAAQPAENPAAPLAKPAVGVAVARPTAPVVAEPVQAPVVQRQSAVPARIPCPFCGEEIPETAIKCRHCNEFLDGRQRPQQPAPQQVYVAPALNVSVVQQVQQVRQVEQIIVRKRWSRLVAMLLSFFIPGLGQLYKGQPVNAVAWFVLTVIGYVLFIIPGLVLHFCCILGAGTGDPYR